MFELIESVMSCMYNRKRTGPKTEPRGTPEMTLTGDEWESFIDTVCVSFDKKEFIFSRYIVIICNH